MTGPVGLRWDLDARNNASRAFDEAAASAQHLADNANQAIRALRELGTMSPNIRIQTNATTTAADLQRVRDEAARLGGMSPEIRVRVDTSTALADIRRMRDEMDRIRMGGGGSFGGGLGGAGHLGGGAAAAGGGMPWWAYLLPLSPLAIPIGAVGAAGGATALLGLNQAKKSLAQLKPEYQQLQAVAGKSLAPGLNSLVSAAKSLEPLVAQMSKVFGGAISHEATLFSNMLKNGGFQQFVSYAEANLPSVLDLFNNLAMTVGNVVRALAPLGSVMLKATDGISHFLTGASAGLVKLEQGAGGATIHAGFLGNLFGPHGDVGRPPSGAPQIGAPMGPTPSWFTRDLSNPVRSFFGLSQISTAPTAFAPPTRGMVASTRASQVPLFAPALQYTPSKAALNAIRADEAALKSLTAAYQNLRDAQLAEAQAEDLFHVDVNGLSQAMKGQTHSLNVNTLAGATNKQMLDKVLLEAQNGAKASKDYGRQLLANVKDFQRNAEAAGFSKKAIDGLLSSMHLMPAQIKSTINVETGAAKQNLDFIQRQIAELPTYKTVTIDTNFVQTHTTLAPTGSTYRSQVPHAAGGMIPPNQVFTVGEAGFEGGVSDSMGRVHIFSNAQSRAMGFRTPVGYANGTGGGRSRTPLKLVVGGAEFDAYLDGAIEDYFDHRESVGGLG